MKKSNLEARKKLEALYSAKCMLTGLKTKLNYHHIIKKCDGGNNSIQNGALINREAHDFLHSLEITDKALYEELNLCLQCYKVAYEWQDRDCLEAWKEVEKETRKRLIKK